MSLSETAALKFALSKTVTWSFPRETLYDLVVSRAGLSGGPFSVRTVNSVGRLARRLAGVPETPARRILLHDLRELHGTIKDVDPGYDPTKLPTMIDGVIKFLEDELETKAPVRLNFSVVEKYPAPYEDAIAAAWSLSEFESKMLGMPQGVYVRRDQVFPVSAECILGHEYAHSVIVDLPNYVPWLDEGLADILGYVYYVRKVGSIEDLPAWVNYRSELKQYGHWYAEYDRLVAALLTTCGLEFVRTLVRLKRETPKKVAWTRLAQTIRSNPSYEALSACVDGQTPAPKPLPPDYLAICTLFTAPTLTYTISTDAFAVMLNLFDGGGKTVDKSAFKGIAPAKRKSIEGELRDHNLVFRDGKKLAVFGGPLLGSDQLFTTNLVRARVTKELAEGAVPR